MQKALVGWLHCGESNNHAGPERPVWLSLDSMPLSSQNFCSTTVENTYQWYNGEEAVLFILLMPTFSLSRRQLQHFHSEKL
jgi:hypothetical protein